MPRSTLAPRSTSDAAALSGGSRLAYLDNLKVGMIAGIIATHAVAGYAAYGSWAYQDLREVSLSSAAETSFVVLVTIPGLFVMGLFFLISGLLTPGPLDRKGPGRFARDRLLRLGAPFAVFTLVLWPGTMWIANSIVNGPRSFRTTLADMDPVLDNGPMWFVGVLLLYSLAYAAWRRWRPAERRTSERRLTAGLLVWIGAGIATASFAVRIWFPVDSAQPANLHLWEWPQCLAMFGLGIACARHGWLSPVPDGVRRRCGWLAAAAAATLPVMVLSAASLGLTEEDYYGGIGVPSLLTVLAEATLVLCASIWILGVAQRRLDGRGPVRSALARSSYAAFVLQAPVLVGFALALRPFDAPAEVKAAIVAVLGVACSFWLGWALVTRTPLRRIL